MNLIENERTKLLATALNNTAVASRWWFLFWLLWLLVGIGLHLSAQSILGRLQE